MDLIEDTDVFRKPQDVEAVAESYRQHGQGSYIHLLHRPDQKLEILDGVVRYRAAVRLDWEHINALIYYDLTPEEAAQLRRRNAMSKVLLR